MTVQTTRQPLRIWLALARLLYLALFAIGIFVTIASLPEQLDPESYICTQEAEEDCGFETVRPFELAPLERFGLTPELYVLYRFWTDTPVILILFLGVSLLIFLLRSDEWISLLSAAFLLTFPVSLIAASVIEKMPAWAIPWWLFSTIGGASVVVVFYVFPDGKFVPGWTRWLALGITLLTAGVRLLQVLAPGFENQSFIMLFTYVYFLLLVVAFISQIYRYRRFSSPTQRQQTKWVVTAAIMMPLSDLVIRHILNAVLPWANQPGAGRVIHYMITIPTLRTLPFMLVPISFAFAILRYRLWDIDVLIRRTLQYSLLSALLAGGYFSSVLLLQTAFSFLGGSQNTLITVISTLAIAALFTQLRRRVQDFIDWRFFRRKYDAEQTLADFAAAARSETDLAQLTSRLTGAVQEAIQPEQVSLWLAKEKGFLPALAVLDKEAK